MFLIDLLREAHQASEQARDAAELARDRVEDRAYGYPYSATVRMDRAAARLAEAEVRIMVWRWESRN